MSNKKLNVKSQMTFYNYNLNIEWTFFSLTLLNIFFLMQNINQYIRAVYITEVNQIPCETMNFSSLPHETKDFSKYNTRLYISGLKFHMSIFTYLTRY